MVRARGGMQPCWGRPGAWGAASRARRRAASPAVAQTAGAAPGHRTHAWACTAGSLRVHSPCRRPDGGPGQASCPPRPPPGRRRPLERPADRRAAAAHCPRPRRSRSVPRRSGLSASMAPATAPRCASRSRRSRSASTPSTSAASAARCAQWRPVGGRGRAHVVAMWGCMAADGSTVQQLGAKAVASCMHGCSPARHAAAAWRHAAPRKQRRLGGGARPPSCCPVPPARCPPAPATPQFAMKRAVVGIWKCKACKKTQAGGAYVLK